MKEITPKELKAKLDAKEPVTLIDVREDNERAFCNIGGLHIPMGMVQERVSEIPKTGEVVIYCRSGGRSGRVVSALQATAGYTNLINLKGGILGWSDEVDSSVPKY